MRGKNETFLLRERFFYKFLSFFNIGAARFEKRGKKDRNVFIQQSSADEAPRGGHVGRHPAPAARALRRSRRASVSGDLCGRSGFRWRGGGLAAAASATAAAAKKVTEEAPPPTALNSGTGGGGAAALAVMTWLSTAYAAGAALLTAASALVASTQRERCEEKAAVVAETEAAAASEAAAAAQLDDEEELALLLLSLCLAALEASSSDIALEIAAAWNSVERWRKDGREGGRREEGRKERRRKGGRKRGGQKKKNAYLERTPEEVEGGVEASRARQGPRLDGVPLGVSRQAARRRQEPSERRVEEVEELELLGRRRRRRGARGGRGGVVLVGRQ